MGDKVDIGKCDHELSPPSLRRRPGSWPRLVECTEALLKHEGASAQEILGETDAIKLRSSMTLFAAVAPEQPVFQRALDRFYAGEPDRADCFAAGEP